MNGPKILSHRANTTRGSLSMMVNIAVIENGKRTPKKERVHVGKVYVLLAVLIQEFSAVMGKQEDVFQN